MIPPVPSGILRGRIGDDLYPLDVRTMKRSKELRRIARVGSAIDKDLHIRGPEKPDFVVRRNGYCGESHIN